MLTLAFAAPACGQPAASDGRADGGDPAATHRVYYIGNSLTDNIRYAELAEAADALGETIVWGRHMIPGSPLSWLWENQDTGFTRQPYGASRQALSEHAWDVVSLQPFDRHLEGTGGDLDIIGQVVRVAEARSPDARFAIYWHGPRMRRDGKALPYDSLDYDPAAPGADLDHLGEIDDFGDLWTQPYAGRGSGGGAFEARDYYQQLTAALRAAHPQRRFVDAPVGEVMYALHRKMQGGEVEGYRTAWRLYRDTIHLSPTGCYVAGATYFAVITGRSARGLPHEPYGEVDATLVPVIQATVDAVLRDLARADAAASADTASPHE
jgi:hypothetical protein